jgi:hypothetical protein
MINLLDAHNILEQDGIFFSFSGRVTQTVLVGLGSAIESKLQDLHVPRRTITDIFSIFTEQMQNMINYAKDHDNLGLFIMGYSKKRERYFVGSGNYIDEEDIPNITQKLGKLQVMSKSELKDFYLQTRRDDRDVENEGAGLGLIEIARRASEPIEYEIAEKGEHMFFQIIAYI